MCYLRFLPSSLLADSNVFSLAEEEHLHFCPKLSQSAVLIIIKISDNPIIFINLGILYKFIDRCTQYSVSKRLEGKLLTTCFCHVLDEQPRAYTLLVESLEALLGGFT